MLAAIDALPGVVLLKSSAVVGIESIGVLARTLIRILGRSLARATLVEVGVRTGSQGRVLGGKPCGLLVFRLLGAALESAK